jgi:lipoate-protein ligase B
VQDARWRARCAGGPDVVLACEHPPTVTFGRRAMHGDLRVPAADLAARGIACVATERGGGATYHGPGQLVLYPIVALAPLGLGVAAFVWTLEEIMLAIAAAFGVHAERNPCGRGVWSARGKLGAVGIRVRAGVTTHGLALNVTTDLTPFALITPCGVPGLPVTSLAAEGVRDASVARALAVAAEACTRLLAPAARDGGVAEARA